MRIERHTDPVAYETLVRPLLMRDEPRFNLELAVLARVAGGETFGAGAPLLLTVGDDGAALMTPPHNLLIAPVPYDAAVPLAEHVADVAVPGTLGEPATVRAFAERYGALSGRTPRETRGQGVYVLRELIPPRPVPGALCVAGDDDADLVVAWVTAFTDEVDLPHIDAERTLDRVREGMVWLWVDRGEPVSLAGCGGFTPTGARVGPVYTPPALRGRGYASAVSAGVTRALLDRGLACTFLYTDLANPTSNKIYRALGYRHVTDVIEVTFDG